MSIFLIEFAQLIIRYPFPQQENRAVAETAIKMVSIEQLQDLEGHHFKVENDMVLFELMQSIEKEGVIVPALARPKAGGGYELIAGHRRKAACKWAGIDVMPVVIRDLDDNQAVIAMVDSNLQREHLKPSEKAFAYKMKLETMKRQGTRTDLTSPQVGKKLSSSQVVTATSDQDGPKLENPTMKIYPLQSGHDEVGNWIIQQDETTERAINSKEAYDMFNRIVEKYVAKHKPGDTHSTMEMWKLREQAKQLAEEVIYGEIVYKYH